MIAIAGGGGVNLFNSTWTADYLKITGELDVDLRSNIARRGAGQDRLRAPHQFLQRCPAAGELESQSPGVVRHIREAAKNVEGLSNNLRNRSVDELMHAASDLARSQPGIFIAGAVAAGFALSRFLKSSAPNDSARPSSPGSSAHGSPATRAADPYYPAGAVSPKL